MDCSVRAARWHAGSADRTSSAMYCAISLITPSGNSNNIYIKDRVHSCSLIRPNAEMGRITGNGHESSGADKYSNKGLSAPRGGI